MITVGVIGDAGHARRLIDLMDGRADVEVRAIYHPRKQVADRRGTNDLSRLAILDAVVIASPTHTHASYIHSLRLGRGYKGYILCEKLPFSTRTELDYFRTFDDRLYFNFNFRHSDVSRILHSQAVAQHVGIPLHANVRLTHGLAYTGGYPSSWRADVSRHPLGPVETVACHWIDVMLMKFGDPTSLSVSVSNVADTGTAPDTGAVSLVHTTGVTTSVFVSYAAPKSFSFVLVGTQGVLEFDDKRIEVRSPRDTFDSMGLFAAPPAVLNAPFDLEVTYMRSLSASLDEFFGYVASRTPVDGDGYAASIGTNDVILDTLDEVRKKGRRRV